MPPPSREHFRIPMAFAGLLIAALAFGAIVDDMYDARQPVAAATASASARGAAVAASPYTERLAKGWSNRSWGARTDFGARPALQGNRAISLTVRAPWGALYLKKRAPIAVSAASWIQFAARAGKPGQAYNVMLYDGSNRRIGRMVSLDSFGGQPTSVRWQRYSIPISAFRTGVTSLSGIVIQDAKGSAQPPLLVDAVRILRPNSPIETATPMFSPTPSPTTTPTTAPTTAPTVSPTAAPTSTPTGTPTATPNAIPTGTPNATTTPTPSPSPTSTTTPTASPTPTSTTTPTPSPMVDPSEVPSSPTPTPSVSPTASPTPSGATYPWHTDITATVFWVGEPVGNGSSEDNALSAYDDAWQEHYGGFDDYSYRRTAQENYFPRGFTPKENPFYLDLPYDDLNVTTNRRTRTSVIPWAIGQQDPGRGYSFMKNRWVRIERNGVTCYGQNQDAGPYVYNDAAYVFGSDDPRPQSTEANNAGMDVSPALRDCLGFRELNGDRDKVNWQFVDAADVPEGPWTIVVTTSGVYQP